MPDDFSVTVNQNGFDRNGQPRLVLRWIDPLTGKRCRKAAGTHKLAEAQRRAGALQNELRAGKYAPASKLTWQDFTWRYSDEVLPGLARKTAAQAATAFNAVERILRPRRLIDVTADRLSHFDTRLRLEGKSPATRRSYLAHLRAAMKWAVDVGLLVRLPKFPKVARVKGQKMMKGRPITPEEFERMLAQVPRVLAAEDRKHPDEAGQRRPKREVNPAAVESWRHYLRGLWWSGLRLRESLDLSWDARAGLSIDLSGQYPMIRIRAHAQKSGREELCPVAPEFAEMLLATPPGQRRGRVFRLLGARDKEVRCPIWVSKLVERIGRAARIKVDERTKRAPETGERVVVVKYASAHDLRRSFGFRWSRRILPPELRELMRHADISTTMTYYVGLDAQTTAGALWAAYHKATGDAPAQEATHRATQREKGPESGRPRNDESP